MYDSALKNSHLWKFLSRTPETHKKVKETLQKYTIDKGNWVDLGKGYKQIVKETIHKGVIQRWAIIYSQQAYDREIKTFQKNLIFTRETVEKNLWHLSNEVFKCEADAHKAAKKFDKKNTYHVLEYTINSVAKYEKAGKPKPGQEKKIIGFQIKGIIKDNDDSIQKAISKKGKFILATNELNEERLANEDFLKLYKEQSHNERGFAFIKNKAFEVSSVFLKKPSRISSLMVIMTLCLMVYGLLQYMLRKKLEDTGETLPNQVKKPTQKPSMQFIFTRLRSVHVIQQRINGSLYETVLNLGVLAKKIISLLGPTAMRIYGIPLLEQS
jgi:transposase